ncbi:hypothetical protein [Deinococcus malanensis]|nr:hypothetical protein [Deinococcus malanensis]
MDTLEGSLLKVEHASAHEDPRGVSLSHEVITRAQELSVPEVEVRARLALAWTLMEQKPTEAHEHVRMATYLAEAIGHPGLQARAHCLAARMAV